MSAAATTESFIVRAPASHPSLPGHFPGQPIVPGVVLLDLIIAALPTPLRVTAIQSAKFLSPAAPEESIDVRVSIGELGEGGRRAQIVATRDGAAVLEATLVCSEPHA